MCSAVEKPGKGWAENGPTWDGAQDQLVSTMLRRTCGVERAPGDHLTPKSTPPALQVSWEIKTEKHSRNPTLLHIHTEAHTCTKPLQDLSLDLAAKSP